MARRALSPTCLRLVRTVESIVPPAMRDTGLDQLRIGLSGGADSLALTASVAWARDHRHGELAGVSVRTRIVDHGLQPDSADIAQIAAEQSARLGIDSDIVRVDVDPTGTGVEAAAREARYAALTQGPDALILLAHTLDDQAETVLLGLARGSGVRSLSGMAPCRDTILRPFLSIRRTDTEQACHDWGLTYWNDPSNSDPAYSRSRLRTAMGTLDEVLGPGLPEALSRSADLARADADCLDELARQVGIDPSQPAIPVQDLAEVHPALRHRILLAWLRTCGQDRVTRDHVLAVDALITDWHGQKSISVPGGRVQRRSGLLRRLETPDPEWGQA